MSLLSLGNSVIPKDIQNLRESQQKPVVKQETVESPVKTDKTIEPLKKENSLQELTSEKSTQETVALIKESNHIQKMDDGFGNDMLEEVLKIPVESPKIPSVKSVTLEENQAFVKTLKDKLNVLEEPLKKSLSSIDNKDAIKLFNEMKSFVESPVISTSKQDIQGKLNSIKGILSEAMSSVSDVSKANTLIRSEKTWW